MQTILVINSKGGSGKTTLTTNLASYFVNKGHKTTILDYDPQGSSLQWLKVRPSHQPTIHGANAAPSKKAYHLRSIAMAVPSDTEYLIIDAPAGAEGIVLQEMVRKSSFILIPVAPSAIDIHATADFIKQLLLVGGIRYRNIKTAIVANRVRNTIPVYEPLERFLNTLKLPFLTKLSDADNYIFAAEQGLGVYEMDKHNTDKERDELKPVINWLSNEEQEPVISDTKKSNVVSFDAVRQYHR
jgi:chromosome partitioning protein